MDTVYIVGIVGAVIVLCFLGWKFDVLKLSGRHGESEGSLEARRAGPGPPAVGHRPATGAVSIGGNATGATVGTNVAGAAETGAGGVKVGGDADNATITTNVEPNADR